MFSLLLFISYERFEVGNCLACDDIKAESNFWVIGYYTLYYCTDGFQRICTADKLRHDSDIIYLLV